MKLQSKLWDNLCLPSLLKELPFVEFLHGTVRHSYTLVLFPTKGKIFHSFISDESLYK